MGFSTRSWWFIVCAAHVSWGVTAPLCRDGLVLFPAPGSVVPTNTQFIIEGTGEAQNKVQSLLEANGLALVAMGQEPIAVKAEKGFVSTMSRVAVRLRPLQSLKPNVKYTLALPAMMTGLRLLNDASGEGQLRWQAGPGPDVEAPKLKSRPVSSEGLYEEDAEGRISRQLRLRAAVEEQSFAWALVTVERARGTSMRQQYPVPVDGSTLTLGHDGCSGSFGFEDGRTYKLNLEFFDVAGNKASKPFRLEVSSPRPNRRPRR